MGLNREPDITVEGVLLTEAQAMTLRVALSLFLVDLASAGLGDDEHGKAMAENYLKNGRHVEWLMHGKGEGE